MAPERWLELTIKFSGEPEELASLLFDYGGTAVQEADGAFVTFLADPPDPGALSEELCRRLMEASPGAEIEVSFRWQPQKDWESLWREGLGLRRITSRLLVVPSWEEVEGGEGEILLSLDPGMAFGTAEHATTRGCLRMLDTLVAPGSRMADVGAGSGILSIAAARMGATEVLALEMDEMSCETARDNVRRNGVEDCVTIRRALVDGQEPLAGAPYDGIVANLQSHLLIPLLSAFRGSLDSGGWLVLSGILVEEREDVLSAAAGSGFALQTGDEEDGWWTGSFEQQPGPA